MTKYLNSYIVNAVKIGNLNSVKRFLKLHANDDGAINAEEKEKFHIGFFCDSYTTGWNGDLLPHLAIRHGRMGILAALIANEDVGINFPNRRGVTPLSLAVHLRNLRAINLLLASPEVEVDAVDSAGFTALTLAAAIGVPLDILKSLLDHGADKNHITDHKAAAQMAISFGHREIAEFIHSYQPSVPSKQQANAPRPTL